jgi:ubiquinone/menaquinone biosynthesis C-methylase UbiE
LGVKQLSFLEKIQNRLTYDQKTEWDRIALSFLRECPLILDVGCGLGRFIAQDHQRIIGLDMNESSLQKCRGKGYTVKKGDARGLPFSDNEIGGIHCSHVIEHFMPDDVHKILSEFARVLAPGGVLVIRSPLLSYRFYSDLTHVKPYNPEVIMKYLMPSQQRTMKHLSDKFSVVCVKWRHKKFRTERPWLIKPANFINSFNLPVILPKDGYMLVMSKSSSMEDC